MRCSSYFDKKNLNNNREYTSLFLIEVRYLSERHKFQSEVFLILNGVPQGLCLNSKSSLVDLLIFLTTRYEPIMARHHLLQSKCFKQIHSNLNNEPLYTAQFMSV